MEVVVGAVFVVGMLVFVVVFSGIYGAVRRGRQEQRLAKEWWVDVRRHTAGHRSLT